MTARYESLLLQNVCSTLWCTVGTTCHSKLDGAVDGTSCGEDKVSLLLEHEHKRYEMWAAVGMLIRFLTAVLGFQSDGL